MTTQEILAAVASKKMTVEQAQAEMATVGQKPLSLKVGEKGGVVVSGLNARFPVTLYADQWERLFDFVPTIKAFIDSNKAKLSFKPSKAA